VLSVRGLKKTFKTERGVIQAVAGVSFEAPQGQFYTLLGPSGCGKTTTLQCIAGLESPDEGEIELGNTPVFASSRLLDLAAHMRDVGMVFQSYAIWPHMTVYENVAYPLVHGRRKMPNLEVRDRVLKALKLVELETFANRPAPFLSGGQQQRVALARALVDEPKVLLLDEPLSNLDAKLREGMRFELRRLIKRLNITTLFVTHDQIEALSMSDRVAVMFDGRIVQEGTPRQIYLQPENRFVANFVGKVNLFEARVAGRAPGRNGGLLSCNLGELVCGDLAEFGDGDRVLAAIRPEAIVLEKATDSPADHGNSVVSGRIEACFFYGDHIECQVNVCDEIVNVRSDAYTELAIGERVSLIMPRNRIVLFRVPERKDQPRGEIRVDSATAPRAM
jgi:iron(III) transport system ATP-binding protein